MPGKVNPVMAENLDMVCFHVVGRGGRGGAARRRPGSSSST